MFNRMTWIAILGLTGALAGGAGCALDESDELDESALGELSELDESIDGKCGVPPADGDALDMRVTLDTLDEGILVADPGLAEDEPEQLSPWCAAGWHEHVVTWPHVGRANGPCREHRSTIALGRHVCMLNTSASVCNGQGYTQVYLMETEVPDNWLWSRTEAFNGH
jgi:hypothetical protein